VIDGDGMEVTATITNAGLIEATTFEGLFTVGPITNSGTIAALGNGARLGLLENTVIDSTTKALILASGSGAQVQLDGETIKGGTLKSSAGGEIEIVSLNSLSNVTIAASSFVEMDHTGVLTINGGTIGAAAVIETPVNGGAAIVSGTVTNGGTLFASAAGSLVEIASGAVVNGGVALIGDGTVEIAGSSGESVRFLSNGTGGLELDGLGSAYRGKVSGFGGSSHSNHDQFIDFTAIGSGATVSYTSAASHTSGTLMVTSGGVSATVTLVGNYSPANFSSSTVGGHVRITDPGVVNGGGVEPGVPDITLGAQTTLAYSELSPATGLGATQGRYAAAIALLCNYMAGSFATAPGNGGMLISGTLQAEQQSQLTHPPHG
jgi:hypothetical protein